MMIQEQAQETHIWRAVYDGEVLCEENADNFAAVDQSRVTALLLYPLQGGAAHRMDVPQGAQAVFFRRRSVELFLQGESAPLPTVHCIGWELGDEAVYLFVFEDNSTLLSNDLQAV